MRTRRRNKARAARRLFPLLVVVPLATVGSAALAANVIPVTYAGQTLVTFDLPTVMSTSDDATINVAQDDGHDYYHFIHVAAVLHGAGDVSGRTVTFVANGGVICQDTTQADGSASCPNNTKVPTSEFSGGTPTTFTATFAGGGGLAASSASGDLTQVG